MMLAGATAVEVGAANLVNPYACRDIVLDLPRRNGSLRSHETDGSDRRSALMGKDVIIACDFAGAEGCLRFLDRFTGEKPFVKIGMELFYAEGPARSSTILKERGHQHFPGSEAPRHSEYRKKSHGSAVAAGRGL